MQIVGTRWNSYSADEIDFDWMEQYFEPTKEPVSVAFDCQWCAEKHASFAELVTCFKEQSADREVTAVVVA